MNVDQRTEVTLVRTQMPARQSLSKLLLKRLGDHCFDSKRSYESQVAEVSRRMTRGLCVCVSSRGRVHGHVRRLTKCSSTARVDDRSSCLTALPQIHFSRLLSNLGLDPGPETLPYRLRRQYLLQFKYVLFSSPRGLESGLAGVNHHLFNTDFSTA